MEAGVKALFERYERFFRQAICGGAAPGEAASFYAPEFIAATPAGVMTGKNDARLGEVMTRGFARYRAIGTRDMRIRDIRLAPIDDHHCVAHVAWTTICVRDSQPDVSINFEVHYTIWCSNWLGSRRYLAGFQAMRRRC